MARVASPVERELQLQVVVTEALCELAVESCAPLVGLEAHFTLVGVDVANRLVEENVFVLEPFFSLSPL